MNILFLLLNMFLSIFLVQLQGKVNQQIKGCDLLSTLVLSIFDYNST